MKDDLRVLRHALLQLNGVLNRPQPDAALIASAGVDLDRALFPLLARIEFHGPIGVVELAELSGRDYSTVSRQVAKLEQLALVERKTNAHDARVREATLTKQGRVVMRSLDRSRQKLLASLFVDWRPDDVKQLATLMSRFADDARRFVGTLPS